MSTIIPEPKRYSALSVVEQDRGAEKQLDHEESLMISADDYEILLDYANLLEARLNLEHGDDITAEPARSYSELKKQFLSLRRFANAKSSQASFFRSVAEGLFGSRLVCSEQNIESERKANAMLTNLLEESEARCEALKKEVDALKSEMSNQIKEGFVCIPATPSESCLVSMAIRYDHGLGVPGYYDGALFKKANELSHEQKMEFTKRAMRKLYEEATGQGFYKHPE